MRNSPSIKSSVVSFVSLCWLYLFSTPALFSYQETPDSKIHPRAVDLVIQASIYDLNGQYRAALNAYHEALIFAPNSPSILNAIAEDYVRLRKLDSAVEMLERNIAANPEFLESHQLRATIAFQKGDVETAEREYLKIVELDSSGVEAYLRLAEIYRARNDLDKAAEQYERLIDRDLAKGLIRFELGRLYVKAEKYDDAQRVFKDYVVDFPEDERGYLFVGEVLIAKGDTTKALEWYKTTYEENGDFVTVREQLTMTLVALKEWNSAIAIYDEVAKADSSDLFSRIRLGELYYAQGDTVRAMEIFHENTENYPDDWRAYNKLGDVYLFRGEASESIPYYERTIELKKDHANAWLRLGLAYQRDQQFVQAEEKLRKAQKLAPASFGTNLNLGNLLFQQKQFKEAVKFLLLSLKVAPDNIGAIGALAAAYDEIGEHRKTVELYEKALEIDPDNSVLLNNFSYSLIDRDERLEDALQMVTRALEAEPDNGAYLDTLGWVYYKLGEYDKALDHIKKSLADRDDSAEVLEHLGHVYEKLGETELAIQFWKKAVELEPDRANFLPQLKNN